MAFFNKRMILLFNNLFLLAGIGTTIANYSTSVIQGEANDKIITTYSLGISNSSSSSSYVTTHTTLANSELKADFTGDINILSTTVIDATSNKVYPGSGSSGGVFTTVNNAANTPNVIKLGKSGTTAADAGKITFNLTSNIYSVRVTLTGWSATTATTITLGIGSDNDTVQTVIGNLTSTTVILFESASYFNSFFISSGGPSEQRAIIYSIQLKYC